MACAGLLDLIAYPGARFVSVFKATTETDFRKTLATCLTNSGWNVQAASPPFGGGSCFEALSRQSPWCPATAQPEEYQGRVKVKFYTGNFAGLTYFQVSSRDGTIVSDVNHFIGLLPTGNFGDKYSYMFIGTPYDFKIFMLGVEDRVRQSISQSNTAVFCGVPQIPTFLQDRDPDKWCLYGVNEMFYLVQADNMRTGPTTNGDGAAYSAAISSEVGGTHLSTGGTWALTYGAGGSNAAFNAIDQAYWVKNSANFDHPNDWDALMFPSLIGWNTISEDQNSHRLKGFMYDSLTLNKAFPGDARLGFDGHEFVNFTHNYTGSLTPFRAPGSLLLCIGGPF